METKISIAEQIKKLQVGLHFTVPDSSQRMKANRVAKVLRDAGIIKFSVVTRKNADGTFKVAAI